MRRSLATARSTAVLLLTFGLAGCGGGAEEPASASDPGASKPAASAPASEPAADSGAGAANGPSAEATFGEETVSITEGVTCAEAGGTFAMGAGAAGSNIAVTLSGPDATTADNVAVTTESGKALAVAAGQGSSEVSKDGETYTITGSGMVVDPENPTSSGEEDYEIVIICG